MGEGEGLPTVSVEWTVFRQILDSKPTLGIGYVSLSTFHEAAIYDPSSGISFVTRIDRSRSGARSADQVDFEDVIRPRATSTAARDLDDYIGLKAALSPRPGQSLDLSAMFTPLKFVPPAGPIDCTPGPQTALIGPGTAGYIRYHFISVEFDTNLPKDLTINVVVDGARRRWLNFPGYSGDLVLVTDLVEGPGVQIEVVVGQYAGTFDYLVMANTI
jgi:hypothetical protein